MKTFLIAILIGFLFLIPSLSRAGVLEEKNCNSCHRLSAGETEKIFAGPDLHYAGNKFQPEWLKKFLEKPEIIRPAGFITDSAYMKEAPANIPPHPSFSEEDAGTLAQDLMSLKVSPQKKEPVIPESLSKGLRVKTKYEFERTFGCISCHQSLNLAGKIRGGISGPSLVNAGNRLQADWIANWLSTPETYLQKSRMPRYKMDSATQIRFTRFLMSLKKENMK